jgi:hypothetical protein
MRSADEVPKPGKGPEASDADQRRAAGEEDRGQGHVRLGEQHGRGEDQEEEAGGEPEPLEQPLWTRRADRRAEQQREDRARCDEGSAKDSQQEDLPRRKPGDPPRPVLAHLLEDELGPKVLGGGNGSALAPGCVVAVHDVDDLPTPGRSPM